MEGTPSAVCHGLSGSQCVPAKESLPSWDERPPTFPMGTEYALRLAGPERSCGPWGSMTPPMGLTRIGERLLPADEREVTAGLPPMTAPGGIARNPASGTPPTALPGRASPSVAKG